MGYKRNTLIMIILTAMLAEASITVSVSAAASDGVSYDIPINELSKVKKKPVSKTRKSAPKTPSQTAVPDTQNKSASAANKAVKSDDAEGKSSAVTQASAPNESRQIHHSPYSFVVAGKSTLISAVISMAGDIREVSCSMPAGESGASTPVKMSRMNGTLFTYTGTLPAVSTGKSSLRYTITAISNTGGKIISPEYSIPVTASPVVPSWQEDKSEASPTDAPLKAK